MKDNNSKQKSEKKSSKKSYKKKYFKVLGISMLIVCILYGSGFALAFYEYDTSSNYDVNKQVKEWSAANKDGETSESNNSQDKVPTKVRTNFLLVGRDKIAGLTDTIIVGTFNALSGDISLVSVPRDLYTVLERDKIKELNKIGRNPPSYFKLNSLFNYVGGSKDTQVGIKYLKEEVSEIIGEDFNIDYYFMIDTAGFREVVDAIGGIDFDVPAGGLYYSDPGQDLYINLKGGMQHLNGRQAEGLVRFRKGYATQDLKRMEIQQEFLKVFMQTVLSSKELSSNLEGLIKTLMQYVETDFTLGDLMDNYMGTLSEISSGELKLNFKSATLPCEGGMIDGAYYFQLNEDEAKEVIDEYIFGIVDSSETETTSEETTSEKTKK